MADQSVLTEQVLSYIRNISLRDDPVLAQLRKQTFQLPMGQTMQVMAEEGQLLGLLVGLCSASIVVDVGTFTGYSALCMARALPDDGIVITCDNTARWKAIAEEHWKLAAVDSKIHQHIGDAADVLEFLLEERGANSVDLIFIDADKGNYSAYYATSIELVRPGGLIVIDNTLYFGRVADTTVNDAETSAIRQLNESLLTDRRIDLSLVPMADGITLIRKR